MSACCECTSSLFSAAQNNHYYCILYWIEAGADPNAKDKLNNTPLYIAMFNNWKDSKDCLKLLISHNAYVNYQNEDDNTPLHCAAYYGKLNSIKTLIKHGYADPHAQNADKNTPLYMATHNGHIKCVEYLLSVNADPNAKNYNDETALHKAIYCKHYKIAELLIRAGADPDAKDCYQNTAMHCCGTHNLERFVEMLMKAGGDSVLNARNDKHHTPLYSAVYNFEYSLLLCRVDNVREECMKKRYMFDCARTLVNILEKNQTLENISKEHNIEYEFLKDIMATAQ